jgi:hypothetical protein
MRAYLLMIGIPVAVFVWGMIVDIMGWRCGTSDV